MYNFSLFLYSQYYSKDYKDFLKNDNNSNLPKTDNYLIEELNDCKKENENLKNKINQLKLENDKLKNELIKANKIIDNFNNININQQTNNKEIDYLKEIIKNKDNEINNLMIQLKNSGNIQKFVDYNKILFVHFILIDQKINCPIKCLETDTSAEVEEQLYQ